MVFDLRNSNDVKLFDNGKIWIEVSSRIMPIKNAQQGRRYAFYAYDSAGKIILCAKQYKRASAKEAINFIDYLICRVQTPIKTVITDRADFTTGEFIIYLSQVGICHEFTIPNKSGFYK